METTIGMIAIFLLLGILLLRKFRNERRNHLQYITTDKFYNQHKTQEENFIAYMIVYAQLKKAPTTSKEAVEEFFYEHLNKIDFGYVYVTREILQINFMPTVITQAAEQYLKTKQTP